MKKTSPREVYKELLKNPTIALVMEHDLPGVTPEMIEWWWDHMDNDSYKLWHPKEHHTLEWQIPASMVGHVGSIHMACESIGDMPSHILRIRWESPEAAPIKTIYSHVNVGSTLSPGTQDIPMACIVHEYEATANGSRMRSTFTLPAVVPQAFLDQLRKHNITEMSQLPVFLPGLYREKTGK